MKSEFGKSILDDKEDIDIELVMTSLEIDIQKSSLPFYSALRTLIISLIVQVLSKLSSDVRGTSGQYARLIKFTEAQARC